VEPENRSIRMHRHDIKFNFGLKELNAPITDMKFTVDVSRYQHQEIEEDVVGTTFRNNVTSFRGMFEQKKMGVWSGRFGVQAFHRDFSTVGIETLVDGPVKQNSFAVFGLEEFKFERVTLQLGGRIENNRYDPTNLELPGRSFTGFSGAAGARFDLWKGGAFVANYSHGFRAPALEELYNHGPHDGTLTFEIGNSELRPEISNGIDLSLRHQTEKFKAEANFYYYRFKNFVFLAPTDKDDKESGFPLAYYLQGDSRFLGTELSLDVSLHKHLNFFTGVDYVNAELSDGRPLPRIPPLRGRLGLDFHYGNLSIRPEFVAVNRQDRVFIDESPTAGYGTVNITGNYTISKQHAAHIFSVNAFNLNDKLYFNHISFIKEISPEIGRGLRVSYTIRFF
jgi:iron complex outermembrane receptor protein